MEPLSGRLPREQNRVPVIGGISSSSSTTVLPAEINASDGGMLVHITNGGSGGTASTFGQPFPTAGTAAGAEYNGNMVALQEDSAGNLLVNVAAGGAAGTQYTDGGTPPTHPIGNALVWNNGGIWEAVSAAEPLPVTASLSLTNYALETGGNLATTATNSGTIATNTGSIATSLTNLVLPQAATTSGQDGALIQGAATTSAPTYSNAKTYPLSLDTSGNLRVSVTNASLAVTGIFFQTTQPVSLATNTPTLQSGSTTTVTQATGTNLHTVVDSGSITATPAVAGAIANNQQTATTSAVALPSNALTQGVTVEALSTNAVSVFIGGSGVTTATGLELAPGSAVTLPISNSNLVFIRCATGSPVVTFIGV